MKVYGITAQGIAPSFEQKKQTETGFGEMLEHFIAQVNSDLHEATRAQQKLMQGNVEDMASLMATIEKSDISLHLLTEVRNKALEAYQEIMRMQV